MNVKAELLKLLVKPTHDCNLDCRYCYDKQFGVKETMTLEMVEQICKFARNSTDNIIWIWHGGEPLMMAKDWYRKAYKILQEYRINHVSIQSNGTLIDEEWIEMFKEFGWTLSFSFDGLGNEESRGLTDKVVENFKLYQDLYQKSGVIRVCDRNNYINLIDDYKYFKNIGVQSFQINRVFMSPTADTFEEDKDINGYLETYAQLLDLWINDTNPIYIRTFGEYIQYILGNNGYLCAYRGQCINEWIGVNPIGDLYTCDRWFPEEHKYGNINDFSTFMEMQRKSDAFIKTEKIHAKRLEYCKNQKCGIFDFCNGACHVNAILKNGGEKPVEVDCYIRKKEFYNLFNVLRELKPNEVKNPWLQRELLKSGFRPISFINQIKSDYIGPLL